MAKKRMFSLEVVDSDAFLDMPVSSQLLYFHLAMRADDDGFVDNPKKIMRTAGVAEDDLKVLLTKRFILSFESGIIVIKHWKIHNYIAKDRYNETKYLEEKNKLFLKNNGSYTDCIQGVDAGKVRLDKISIDKYIDIQDYFNKEIQIPDNIHKTLLLEEKDKFIDYWTEGSPKKERWQKERVFDIKRRWNRWVKNVEAKMKPKEYKKEIDNSPRGGMSSVGELLGKYKK